MINIPIWIFVVETILSFYAVLLIIAFVCAIISETFVSFLEKLFKKQEEKEENKNND